MNHQPTLFDRYPDAPGFKARDTAKGAADAIAPHVKSLRARVYDEVKAKPGTPEQIARRMGVDLLAIRPRFSELSAKALIVDSGERGESRSGKRAIVWRVPA